MNYSKQRKKILQTLQNNVVHPSAEYIHSVLKKEHYSIGLATVYRNLNQLADNDIIKKIEGLDDSVHYDHNISEHYHFICIHCGAIYDIPKDVAPDVTKKAEGLTDFKITHHEITFKGICTDCNKKAIDA